VRIGIAAALTLAATALHAADDTTSAIDTAPVSAQPYPARALIRALIDKETAGSGLPADIADAVAFVESRYDSSVIGSVGEVGAMQVRPETAAMLGFRGSNAELAQPEINVHYGVIYLAKAWRLAQGDLCRALMKYRAGHGEESMTPRSVIYCNRTRNRLVAINSPFAAPVAAVAALPAVEPAAPAPKADDKVAARSEVKPKPSSGASASPTAVYAKYKHGTEAASRAYWAVHEARIRAINAQLAARYHRVASR
jgi:soluble lytic murein transglycosylase-like protein